MKKEGIVVDTVEAEHTVAVEVQHYLAAAVVDNLRAVVVGTDSPVLVDIDHVVEVVDNDFVVVADIVEACKAVHSKLVALAEQVSQLVGNVEVAAFVADT